MTITNRELFYRDPTETKIPNDGVAKVGRPETDQQWDVLRWELRSFVCDGQYERGLERILGSFLANLSQAKQPAVWVSGFYGSGKSHLVRVLEYLWRDVELPGGDRARDLVDPLRRRARPPHRALDGGQAARWACGRRPARSRRGRATPCGWRSCRCSSRAPACPRSTLAPASRSGPARTATSTRIRAAVEAEGRTLDEEIHDLYVSPVIAKALLELDPSLGGSVKDVRELLKTQFPPTTRDITDDEMFDAMDDVLRLQSTTKGKLPLTLVVLDEMQQYIGDDNDKALDVQNIVEGCSARFASQVLFVATGQSALTATPTLQKLIDRFAVPVALSDNDVETVVREVVLRKKPEHVPTLKSTLDAVSGRDRSPARWHPARAAGRGQAEARPRLPAAADPAALLVEMLRAIDRAGKAGLLRTQLGLVHGGSSHSWRTDPIGHVIGADYLFFDEQGTRRHAAERGAAPGDRRAHPAHDERRRRRRDEGPHLRAHLPHLADAAARARRRDRAASDGAIPRRSPRRRPRRGRRSAPQARARAARRTRRRRADRARRRRVPASDRKRAPSGRRTTRAGLPPSATTPPG